MWINLFCFSGWIKKAKPFRGDYYDEYSKPKKIQNGWSKAFELISKVESGEYEPPPIEDEPEKLTGKKRKKSSAEEKKEKKLTGKNKKSQTKEPPQKKARTTKTKAKALPKSPRKTKVTQVKMSNDVIKSISQKLKICIDNEEHDKIETLLDILSKIEVSDPTIFKVCLKYSRKKWIPKN